MGSERGSGNYVSKRDERLERLASASDQVSAATIDDLYEQGKKAAASMLLHYGDKTCLSATGFIYCVQAAHEAALLHLMAEGIVVLAPDAQCSEEERAERETAKAAQQQPGAAAPAPQMSAYL